MVDTAHRSRMSSAARASRGFSLIELLVAVLVMGIGVLGVTALQMVSMQNNRAALERGEAVHLAYDMMDRIRANPGAAYGGLGFEDAPPAAPNCVAGACTAAQMAAFDQASWKCLLGEFNDDGTCTQLRDGVVLPLVDDQPGLPQGDGEIAVNGDVVTITIRWRGADGTTQTIVIDSQG